MAIDLDALERLALEATPGKWSVRPASNGGLILLRPCVQEYLQVLPEEDARHIAATNPDTILDLVRELRAARSALKQLLNNSDASEHQRAIIVAALEGGAK